MRDHLSKRALAWVLTAAMLLPSAVAHPVEPIKRYVQPFALGQYIFEVSLPVGLKLELVSPQLERPRIITFGPDGVMWLGSQGGAIYRAEAPYDNPVVVGRHRDYPHSVAVRDGELLIATTSALFRSRWTRKGLMQPTKVIDIPGGRGHSSRTVRVGPDERLYLSLGIRGNCDDEYLGPNYPATDRRGGITVLDESVDPPTWKPVASGLRNPVGFDWHPQTKALYATNNGPDHLGFELPPELFVKATPGSFHGMPWFQWDGTRHVPDNCIQSPPPRARDAVPPPAATFPARSAPMDMTFARSEHLSGRFEGDAVVAIRGSWGTAPTGSGNGDPATRRPPRLAIVRFENGEAVQVDDFLTGFQLPDGRRWGRPVGIAFGPDGALYFSSDGGINGLFRIVESAR